MKTMEIKFKNKKLNAKTVSTTTTNSMTQNKQKADKSVER